VVGLLRSIADAVSFADSVLADVKDRFASDTVTITDSVSVLVNGQPPAVLGGSGGRYGLQRQFGINSPEEAERRRRLAALLEETEPYLLDDEDAILALLLADED